MLNNKKTTKIIFTGTIVFVLLVGYYFLNSKFGFGIPCLFHKITDFYCPGCGITRMLFSLLKLDFYQAFRYNPLTFCLLFIYIIYKIISLTKYKINIDPKIYYFLIIIVIIFGIVRNIPLFEYLKPTYILK